MEIAIKKVLCPVDFSEGSDHALRYALAFAAAYDAELELLHVLELPFLPSYLTAGVPDLNVPVERIKQECKQHLDELAEQNRKLYSRITTRLLVGTPFLEIIRAARKGDFDLIVVGTRGKTKLKHILIGSVAEKVVRKAPCPVLSVKHPEHEFVMP